jgi:hypothetical protein
MLLGVHLSPNNRTDEKREKLIRMREIKTYRKLIQESILVVTWRKTVVIVVWMWFAVRVNLYLHIAGLEFVASEWLAPRCLKIVNVFGGIERDGSERESTRKKFACVMLGMQHELLNLLKWNVVKVVNGVSKVR